MSLPGSYVFLQPMRTGNKRLVSRPVPLVTQHEAAPGLHTVCSPLGRGPCWVRVCVPIYGHPEAIVLPCSQ